MTRPNNWREWLRGSLQRSPVEVPTDISQHELKSLLHRVRELQAQLLWLSNASQPYEREKLAATRLLDPAWESEREQNAEVLVRYFERASTAARSIP